MVITKQFSEKPRNLWPEYKCIWQKNISSDTWEIVFGYYETIIRKNTQPIIKYKCIWHRIISSNRDKTRNTISTWRYNPLSYAVIFRLEVACFLDNCFVITNKDFSCIYTSMIIITTWLNWWNTKKINGFEWYIFLSYAFIFRP